MGALGLQKKRNKNKSPKSLIRISFQDILVQDHS